MKLTQLSTVQDIQSLVIACLKKHKGCECEVTDETNPFYDLGFTSEDGVYIACVFEEEFGVCLPETVNPLIDESGPHPRARRVHEIARFIQQFLPDQNHFQENPHVPSQPSKPAKRRG